MKTITTYEKGDVVRYVGEESLVFTDGSRELKCNKLGVPLRAQFFMLYSIDPNSTGIVVANQELNEHDFSSYNVRVEFARTLEFGEASLVADIPASELKLVKDTTDKKETPDE